MSTYFQMDGYGGFIWPAYGVAVIVLVGLLIYTMRRSKAEKATLDKLEAELGAKREKDK